MRRERHCRICAQPARFEVTYETGDIRDVCRHHLHGALHSGVQVRGVRPIQATGS